MIEVKKLFSFLKKKNIDFFAGVPDSILKKTKEYFDKLDKKHLITANEGSAISVCIGHYLSTGKLACAYMQNSGLGNAINPLASIAHQKVYSIPILLIIGWRGAPGTKDEAQHEVKGKITRKLLKLLNIKFCEVKTYKDFKKLDNLIKFSKKFKCPVACLIKKDILFDKKSYKKSKKKFNSGIKRETFLNSLLGKVNLKSKIISTTGYTSRELFQIRKHKNTHYQGNDFYMVGGMGHASMVSLGVAMNNKRDIICLDGDGSLSMHMGSLTTIGFKKLKNFKHIILNNRSHESVGGQNTNLENLDLNKLSKSCGYKNYFFLDNERIMKRIIFNFLKSKGPSLLEVKIKLGTIQNLGRPKKLNFIKSKFMVR